MKFQTLAIFMMQMGSSAAFAPTAPNNIQFTPNSNTKFGLHAIPTAEESAQALTNYMAKAHEAKIAALKELEDKKNAEIKSLKEAIESKSKSTPTTTTSIVPSAPANDAEAMAQRIASYQKFMSEYIVKAQAEKAKAVKEAEMAVAKKYEAKLNAFMLGGSAPADAAIAPAAPTKEEPKLFKERNEKIAAAAKAGKSRWGDKEVEKIGAKAPPSSSIQATPVAALDGPSSVEAADHGLRNDGGVGGLSLAERVANGASAPASAAPEVPVANGATAPAPASKVNPTFYARNKFIADAESAGKQTRWGKMEVNKAVEFSSTALPPAPEVEIVVIPEVEAADHGLRADGGVGGPSLAERVNLGAKLLQ